MPTITNKGVIPALVTAYILKDRDQGAGMRAVGYSETYSTKGNCRKLFDRADVKAEIHRQEVELRKKTGYSLEEYQQDLSEDRDLARNLKQPSAAISATGLMGRSCGHDKDNNLGSKDQQPTLTPTERDKLRQDAIKLTG